MTPMRDTAHRAKVATCWARPVMFAEVFVPSILASAALGGQTPLGNEEPRQATDRESPFKYVQ